MTDGLQLFVQLMTAAMTTQPWDSLYSFPSYSTGTTSFCFSAAIWNPLTPDWMTKIHVSSCYSTERMTLQQDQVNTGFEIILSCAARNPYTILKVALSSCLSVCTLVSAFFLHKCFHFATVVNQCQFMCGCSTTHFLLYVEEQPLKNTCLTYIILLPELEACPRF